MQRRADAEGRNAEGREVGRGLPFKISNLRFLRFFLCYLYASAFIPPFINRSGSSALMSKVIGRECQAQKSSGAATRRPPRSRWGKAVARGVRSARSTPVGVSCEGGGDDAARRGRAAAGAAAAVEAAAAAA